MQKKKIKNRKNKADINKINPSIRDASNKQESNILKT